MLLVRGTVCFRRKRQAKQKSKVTSKTACCFRLGSASVLGAAWARVKQHAKVKWHDSPSSMGTDTYDLGLAESHPYFDKALALVFNY